MIDFGCRRVFKDGEWEAGLDRNPISPGHTLLQYCGEPNGIPGGFEGALHRVVLGLEVVFKEGVPDRFKELRRAFPDVNDELVRILFYRLGDAQSEFHVHLMPYFDSQRRKAKKSIKRRLGLDKGGLLHHLGRLERRKDARECDGTANRGDKLDLATVAREIGRAIPTQ